jgi:hypothetical protein
LLAKQPFDLLYLIYNYSMPDLTSRLLPRLTAHRLPGLDLGENNIHPAYRWQACPPACATGWARPPLVSRRWKMNCWIPLAGLLNR